MKNLKIIISTIVKLVNLVFTSNHTKTLHTDSTIVLNYQLFQFLHYFNIIGNHYIRIFLFLQKYRQCQQMGKKAQVKKQRKKKAHPPRLRTEEEFNSTIKVQTSDIKNKQKRLEVRMKRRLDLKNIKAKARKKRKTLPEQQKQRPKTIEDKQEATEAHLIEQHPQHQVDQFQKFLNQQTPIKIMLTTSYKPTKRLYNFMKQLMIMFPNSYYYPRQKFKLEEIYQFAKNMNYSHVVVVRDAGRWELMIRTIQGGLAIFKLTSIMLQKKIFHHGLATDHNPQLVLANFNSKVGVKVGRLFASMFPQNPQFKGRRVVTFHLQRDFIFVRQHRYIFGEQLDKVNMQQIGPRFTLQLRRIYEGNEDGKVGDLEFNVEDKMYVDRKAMYL